MHMSVLTTVSSNICSQMYVQIKHSLVHLQDLIPGIIYIHTYIYTSDYLKKLKI